jgi:hypothetical protein
MLKALQVPEGIAVHLMCVPLILRQAWVGRGQAASSPTCCAGRRRPLGSTPHWWWAGRHIWTLSSRYSRWGFPVLMGKFSIIVRHVDSGRWRKATLFFCEDQLCQRERGAKPCRNESRS